MNTDQNSKTNETTVLNRALMEQFEIIKQFFKIDSSGEMIESLNTMVENYLFTEIELGGCLIANKCLN